MSVATDTASKAQLTAASETNVGASSVANTLSLPTCVTTVLDGVTIVVSTEGGKSGCNLA